LPGTSPASNAQKRSTSTTSCICAGPLLGSTAPAPLTHYNPFPASNNTSSLRYQPDAQRSSLDKHKDFLDSLDLDAPSGCWSAVVDDTSNVVTLRSLLYPGFFFYHVLGSSTHGRLYVGNAERNCDLAFMLS